MREQFEPRMNEVIAELQRARSAAVRAVDAAGDGWESVRHVQSTLRSRQVATETPIL
jgi:hypothetical protein